MSLLYTRSDSVAISPATDPQECYTRVNLMRSGVPFVNNRIAYDERFPMIDRLQLEPLDQEPLLFWAGPDSGFYGEGGVLDRKIFDGIKEFICVDSSPSGKHFRPQHFGYRTTKDEYSFIGAICGQLTYSEMKRNENELKFMLADIIDPPESEIPQTSRHKPDSLVVPNGRSLTYHINTKFEDFLRSNPEICKRITHFVGIGLDWEMFMSREELRELCPRLQVIYAHDAVEDYNYDEESYDDDDYEESDDEDYDDSETDD